MTGGLRCSLCHHRCLIPPGGRGRCGTRENRADDAGEPFLPFYGYLTAVAVDPIEKKPLYHFRPGSRVLSLGFAGCNLRCPFCQNWHISQLCGEGPTPPGRRMKPDEALALVPPEPGARQIAYTYSEPLIHVEYLKDCMELARERGIANVLVSNGCVNLEKAAGILPLIDAANIDLKCFSETTYRQVLGGDLETVLNFIRAACHQGIRLELTTLMVPGLNDSDAELDRCASFIAALRSNPVPWHLSAYHPSYHWDAPPTEGAALLRAAERARKVLPYVYTGNIAAETNDTPCPHCGAILVRRRGYHVDTALLASPYGAPAGVPDGAPGTPGTPSGTLPCRCGSCGAEVPLYR
ncbi:MAG: AmmeMemoRadiSam system radical SAM enzyme [Treponema sp.]|jgi:pyruvate formate lyase activating enzyme|nr:AmmeMemoRadiSam system radical SAM enzyme [Treponema sp.]